MAPGPCREPGTWGALGVRRLLPHLAWPMPFPHPRTRTRRIGLFVFLLVSPSPRRRAHRGNGKGYLPLGPSSWEATLFPGVTLGSVPKTHLSLFSNAGDFPGSWRRLRTSVLLLGSPGALVPKARSSRVRPPGEAVASLAAPCPGGPWPVSPLEVVGLRMRMSDGCSCLWGISWTWGRGAWGRYSETSRCGAHFLFLCGLCCSHRQL